MTNPSDIRKLVIVGSGPAAHSAAIYAGRAQLNPLLFEGLMAGGIAPGGQLTTTTDIENYAGFPEGISGPELMARMRQQSINCDTTIKTETIDAINLQKKPYEVFVGDKAYKTHSIVLCTGATAKRLHLPNEPLLWQKGISACAVCDGALPFFRNKPLCVVGGGDSACEEALFLTKYAQVVYLVHRRQHLRASKIMQERVFRHPKITFVPNFEVVDVFGDEHVEGVAMKNTQNPSTKTLGVGGLFYAIGHKPNTDFVQGQVNMDEEGYVVTEPGSTRTSVEGVFAAGDVQDKHYRQAITSAGTGCMAALDAERFLSSKGLA